MKMRNLLKAGDFVMPIPVGIHLTLQYNSSGNLQKVYTGYKSDRVDVTDKLIDSLISRNMVPAKIHITRGTSWVCGVLYTSFISSAQGTLPNAIESELIGRFIDNPVNFNFFAGTIESTAAIFRGSTPVRQCLAMAKFKILPGWLVPYNFTEDVINEWIDSPQYTFSPIITDYIVFHKETVNIIPNCLTQMKVADITRYVDCNGYVKVKITFVNSKQVLYVDYSDAVRLNIHTGSLLIIDNEKKIVFCKNHIKVREYDNTITCQYCGKHYEIPNDGYVICPDIHCPSRLMQSIVQFIDVLNLPNYSDDVILKWLRTNKVTCIPDLLLLDEYRDVQIELSISELLRSLIPTSLIPLDDIFMEFAIGCSNNEHTLRYYIEHPEKISADLNIHHTDLNRLVLWLSDDCNASDITTLLDSPQISIVSIRKKFEGAPIFRNKTIFVTGKFIRGTISEIAAILQSYSAAVTTQFSNIVDCVLVGGTQEDIDGKSVRSAKSLNKPIICEDDFFSQYDIDADLKANLV